MSDKNIRISESDRDWLKENRGNGNIKDIVSKVIAEYKKTHPAKR